MSNPLAIAAVTATLRNLLVHGVHISEVTARPLDLARRSAVGDQLNLFLYQVLPDAAWRNREMPRLSKPGETGYPPLPLTLYYLLTAYSDDEDDTKAHRLLGQGMSVLHDHPLLGAQEIKDATGGLDGSDLHEQIERVRITLQPLTFEEMSKLWTTFQTHYRVSAAYQVSVVLIESRRPPRTPLPVLRRGEEDRGAELIVGSLPVIEEIRVPLSGAFSTLDNARLAQTLPSAQLNDEIAILGHNFSGGVARVRLKHPLVATPFELPGAQVSDATIIVKLPDAATASATWPAGFYTAAVIISQAGARDRISNELVFSLAPTITISPASATPGDVTLTVTAAPQVRKEQGVLLLFGDQQIRHPALTAATDTLTFDLKDVKAGDYVVRLRVDGVDSLPVDRASQMPKFADAQKLKVS